MSPSVVSLLVSTYVTPAKPLPEPKAVKVKAPKATKIGKVAIVAPKAAHIILPDPTDAYMTDVERATRFLVACRNAGKRTIEGRPVFQAAEERNDTIAAIAAYISYNVGGDFGVQLANAKRVALLAVQPRTVPETIKAPSHVAGFVAGKPDDRAKYLATMAAQEKLAVEAVIDAVKAGDAQGEEIARAKLDVIRYEVANA